MVSESCGAFLVYGFSVYDYTKTACVLSCFFSAGR